MPASINLLNEPDFLSPGNSELWFRLNSASSSTTEFKYIFKPYGRLEPFTGGYTAQPIYKIPPRPITGDGIFSPHKLTKAYFSYDLQPEINGSSNINGGLIQYYVNYGYEYNPSIEWYNTYYFTGDKLGLTFSSPHGLLVGDTIVLDKDNKTLNPLYDGRAEITSVPDTYTIKTDKDYGDVSGSLEGGTITSILRLTSTSSVQLAYNGTRQYNERTTDFTDVYTTNTTSSLFMTNYNSTYKPVFLTDYETISFILGTYSNNNIIVKTYDSSSNFISSYTHSVTSTSYFRKDFGIGPKNLELMSPGITLGVKYYDVHIQYSGATVSETRSYVINDNCSTYDNFRLIFLNRVGGWDYFNFTMDSKKSVKIKRTEYNKILDWDYSIGDRGKTILATKAEDSYTIESNWITEKDSIWLEELLTSPEVYHLTNGTLEYSYDTKIDTNTYANDGGLLRINLNAVHGLLVGDVVKIVNTIPAYNNVVASVYTVNSTTSITVYFTYNGASLTGTDGIQKRLETTVDSANILPIIISDSSYDIKTSVRDKVFNMKVNFQYAYNTNLQTQ